MKLEHRERIEGTNITIGCRVHYRKNGRRGSRYYAAEYRDETGKQVCEDLSTSSRLEARRMAVAIYNRLQEGAPKIINTKLKIEELIDSYFLAVKARGLAPKSQCKYRTDLDKLKTFSRQQGIALAHRFGRQAFYQYREWLVAKGYADKTVYGALTLTKQVFKWAHQERKIREYPLINAKVAKAKALPQPCFTTEQVELIVANTERLEKAVFATLAYEGLRIGELEQLQWADVKLSFGALGMIHVCRGGSSGSPKDKEDRFVPIHPRVRPLLEALPRTSQLVFPGVTERRLLKRLKEICGQIGLSDPERYKLHSFRHHFASLCANHNVAYRKALSWLGHSSSQILDLYYHLHDEDSQAAMSALAADTFKGSDMAAEPHASTESVDPGSEGTLRAQGQSKIEKNPQVDTEDKFVKALDLLTERVGFSAAFTCAKTPFATATIADT